MTTEAVVRRHLEIFLAGRGAAAIAEDYDEDARFYTQARIYSGKHEIERFFEAFLLNLPPKAIPRFALRSMQVHGDVAYITWSIGDDVPLGTDTFVIKDGKIVSQSFAMFAQKAA